MIKSETGSVSMRGTTPVLISELALAVKEIRVAFAEEYGESTAEKLIDRAIEASKAKGDSEVIMKGLIYDAFAIAAKADSDKDAGNMRDIGSILELRKAFGLH